MLDPGMSRDSLEDVVWVSGGEAEASSTSAWKATESTSGATRSSSSLQTLLAELVVQFSLLLLVSMARYHQAAATYRV